MKKSIVKFGYVIVLATLTSQLVFGSNTSSLINQQNSLEEQIKQAEENVKNAKEDREKIVAELEFAEIELAKAKEDLKVINEEVEDVREELVQAEEDYDIATEKRDKQYEDLKDRLSFMYVHGDAGYTDVLLESTDVSDFFKRVEYINSIIKHDKEILNSLEEIQRQIDEQVTLINQKKTEVESLQAQQKAKTQELQVKQSNREGALSKINSNIDAQQDVVYSLEKENAKIEAMIKEAQKNAQENNNNNDSYTYTGGELAFPAPQYVRMSSDYGSRIHPISGKKQFHTGMDFATGYGTDIVAAEAGVVISASYLSGYGNTVIINHGNGLSTLYAHNSSLDVKVGDSVVRGERIAGAGSTGNSTGNHLHFEVRKNGAHQDPKSYISWNG